MKSEQIEFVMHQSPCDIVGCPGSSNSNFGAIKFKGKDKDFTVCNRCLKDTVMVLMVNEGV